ncbi:glycerophosphoryl diester phosphodiesterase [Croceifilum oryzae]|uniref:Glycerophosphoryl diester phosphodiesterase n=1 Tax=Croceifilum oryzae TaxID=1553429 RepID=A0AAJ1WPA7_9BACL|nr:glycerophosphodiester phosphodiesterase [Croceifilum oryzae]MDQ0416352.1 glycerophosphoryl diester phosphodiesterase [Croceifilum oryzae]
MKKTEIYAHRGFSKIAPENTMAAFQEAIQAGADGIELDVHLTRDGEIVVMHDETIDRTTDGTGWIKDLTLGEICEHSAGSWFGSKFVQERVPTLAEVLELLESTSLWLNIELKNNIIRYPRLEEKVLKEVDRFGFQKRVILSSFNHFSLHHLHSVRPHFPLGVLYECNLIDPWDYAIQLGASSIHPFFPTLDEEIVRRSHEAGIAIRPFTVDDPIYQKILFEWGIDALITNDPSAAQGVREQVQAALREK